MTERDSGGGRPVALVTGGSRGIGRSIALRLAETHAVAVNYRSDLSAASSVVAQIRSAGGTAMTVRADVGDSEAVEAMFDQVEQAFGVARVLVANAGVDLVASITATSLEEWRNVFRTDVDGVFYCTRRAVQSLVERNLSGHLIAISSINAIRGWRERAAYSAAKGAVEALYRAAAWDLGPYGITVNVVRPGSIETDMWGERLTDGTRVAHETRTPLGRIGSPVDIAAAVAFLAGPDAEYITGEVLTVDGGRSATDFVPIASPPAARRQPTNDATALDQRRRRIR